jgi:hypothetical protein
VLAEPVDGRIATTIDVQALTEELPLVLVLEPVAPAVVCVASPIQVIEPARRSVIVGVPAETVPDPGPSQSLSAKMRNAPFVTGVTEPKVVVAPGLPVDHWVATGVTSIGVAVSAPVSRYM